MTSQRMLPLYEAKMIHHYDHRWATYDASGDVRDVTLSEKQDPTFEPLPRYWVRESLVQDKLEGRWGEPWLLGWRDICRATDERTAISTMLMEGASPEGGTLLCLPESSSVVQALLLVSNLNSFAFDFTARQKVGGTHLKYFTMRQLPTLPPSAGAQAPLWSSLALDEWVARRAIELVGVSHLAQRSLRTESAPFLWDPERRFLLRAELDAAFFHLYGVERDDVDYVMETFPIVRRKDLAAHGEYRTKRVILEVFDSMKRAIDNGTEYETLLDPPPGQGPRHRGGES